MQPKYDLISIIYCVFDATLRAHISHGVSTSSFFSFLNRPKGQNIGGLIYDNQENRQRRRNRANQAGEGSTKRQEGVCGGNNQDAYQVASDKER